MGCTNSLLMCYPGLEWVRSPSWRRIVKNDGHSLSGTQRETIFAFCNRIEMDDRYVLKQWCSNDEEGKRKLFDLYKDYEDLGKRVLNNPDTPDWKKIEEALNQIFDEQERVLINELADMMNRRTTKLEKTEKYISVEELQGKNHVFEDLNTSDSVENLISRIERNPKVPKHELVLVCNEKTMEETHLVKDYENTVKSICVEELHGKKHVFDNVKSADSVAALMSRIERKTKVPKHELVLVCNGRKMEATHLVKDYDIDGTSSILLLRQKRKGKPEVTSYSLREFVMNKFYRLYDKIGNLFEKFPQFFQDTTRSLTEMDFSRIAQEIGDGWQFLGIELGLDRVKLEHITANNQTMEMKIFDMMIQWSSLYPDEATAGRLYNAVQNCSKVSCNLETLKRIVFGIANI